MKSFKTLLITTAVLFSTCSFAAADGWYIGLGAGRTDADLNRTDFATAATSLDRKDVGFKGLVGYQLSKGFALELNLVDFGEAEAKFPVVPGVPAAGRIRTDALIFSAVGIVPISEKFTIAGKLGIQRNDVSFTRMLAFATDRPRERTGFAWGTRVQFNFTPNASVALDFDKILTAGSNNLELDNRLASLNFIYNFG